MAESMGIAGLEDDFQGGKQRSLWVDALERLIRNRAAMIGLFISVVLVIIALIGPYIAPHDYIKTNISNIAATPNATNWFGTDLIGRDIFSRILHSVRTAIFVVVVVVTISTILGIILGAAAAYLGKWVDDGIMRLTDIILAFPDLLLVAFISLTIRQPFVSWLGSVYQETQWEFLRDTLFLDYLIVFGALALVSWPGYARLIRGQILSLREQDFIRAQVALGVPDRTIMFRHLVPNSIAPVIVSMSIGVGGIILLESSLSFLGFGIQPPGASWGSMVTENLFQWRTYPHLVLMPGLTLALAVIGFNFLGDGLNDALNPRQIRR